MISPRTDRSLYTAMLEPPDDMIFDQAIATTYSLDLEVLFQVPVQLLFSSQSEKIKNNQMVLCHTISEVADKISVYVQLGEIKVPNKIFHLFSMLEKMIIGVNSSTGIFHPKIWVIRFVDQQKLNPYYRLCILSRNMTLVNTWDLSLQLEGFVQNRKRNIPLSNFIKSLPTLASESVEKSRQDQADLFSEELAKVEWELPAEFDEIKFHFLGSKKSNIKFPKEGRLAVISPFCSNEALQSLAKEVNEAVLLLSLPDSLQELSDDTLKLFNSVYTLNDIAQGEYEESEYENIENDNSLDEPLRTDLHAKAYIFEIKSNTHLFIGSANATNAGLGFDNKNLGQNTEVMVELIGKTKKVGGIDKFIEDFDPFLDSFKKDHNLKPDLDRIKEERFFRKIKNMLSKADLKIKCSKSHNTYFLNLIGQIPNLDGLVSAHIFPITVSEDHCVSILNNNEIYKQNSSDKPNEKSIRMGSFNLSSLTGLTVFVLETQFDRIKFVLNLPTVGFPKDRDAAIVESISNNPGDFFDYLQLILQERGPSFVGSYESSELDSNSGRQKDGLNSWSATFSGYLESITTKFCRNPDQLKAISSMVSQMSTKTNQKLIPENFLKLWELFTKLL
jgi:hypothetical protein